MLIFLFLTIPLLAAETSDRIIIKDVIGPKDVKVYSGTVKGRNPTMQKGGELYVGDEIETVAKQIVALEGFDGSAWKIAPETRLKLEARKPDKKNLSYWVFNMITGSMWGKVAPQTDKTEGFKLKVKTRNASMGIRGTEYLVAGDDKKSELDVLEGTIWWGKSEEFEKGSYVEVKAGEHAEMVNGKVEKPTHNPLRTEELVHKYRLGMVDQIKSSSGRTVASTEISESEKRSTQECYSKGMGWRSKDGNPRGECYK